MKQPRGKNGKGFGPIHGLHGTKEYNAWRALNQRCYNRHCKSYKYYGAKGIRVCVQWRQSFLAFLKDMGPCPVGMEIDRINNLRGYSPKNCHWTDHTTNVNNTSRNRLLTYNGKTKTLSQWAKIFKTTRMRIASRLKYGWPISLALSKPVSNRWTGFHASK